MFSDVIRADDVASAAATDQDDSIDRVTYTRATACGPLVVTLRQLRQ